MKTYFSAGCCLVGIGLMPAVICAAEFRSLGDLPGGRFYSSPSEMSADGRVIVGLSTSRASTIGDGREAFIWSLEDGMVGLGFLPSNAAYVASQAKDVSSDGKIILGLASHSDGSRIAFETFRWTRDMGLQSIGIPSSGAEVFAQALSGDGETIAGFTTGSNPTGGHEIFRWTEATGFEVLGTLPWSTFNRAAPTDLSRDGTTIVGEESSGVDIPGERYYSFVWREETGFNRISGPPNSVHYRNYARGVSDDGSVVAGIVYATDGSVDTFVWTEEVGLTPLKFDHDPSQLIHGGGISGDGSIVVGHMFTNGSFEAVVPMIWDAFRGPRDLETLLKAQLADPDSLEGWRLQHAGMVSILPEGTVVVGAGINPHGSFEGWRVLLDPQPAPILIPGDANLDGVVDLLDLERVHANMGIGSFWYQGNFDGVGRVDEADLAIVLANMIPEPSTLILALAATLAMLCTYVGGQLRFDTGMGHR